MAKIKKMSKADVSVIGRSMPSMMARLGFKPVAGFAGEFGAYEAQSKFGCVLRVEAMLDESLTPWLACQLKREPLYSPWKAGDPRNMLYYDINEALGGDVNIFTGKFNCHLFGDSAENATDALIRFETHLKRAMP